MAAEFALRTSADVITTVLSTGYALEPLSSVQCTFRRSRSRYFATSSVMNPFCRAATPMAMPTPATSSTARTIARIRRPPLGPIRARLSCRPMGKAADWLREEWRKTLGDWVAVCVGCGFAQRYFEEWEAELPRECPQCAGELRARCPACEARFSSAFAVDCEA